jgi:flagellar hook-basal body protein
MTAVTGVRAHQTMLDVTGNNIANVNTTGYKKDFTIFQDLLYQTSQGASGPGDARGGTNAVQVGLGVKVGAIETIHTQGAAQFTGNKSDMMISGEGYFVLRDGTSRIYSRAGNFVLDAESNLTHSGTGYNVQGYKMERDPLNPMQFIEAGDIGDIKIPLGSKMEARATSVVGYKCNLDSRSDVYLPIGYADIPYNDSNGSAKVKIDGVEYNVTFTTDLNALGGRGYLTVTFDAAGTTAPPSIIFDMVGIDGGKPVLKPRSETLSLNGTNPPSTAKVSYDSVSGKLALLSTGTTNAGATLWEINLKENMSYNTFSFTDTSVAGTPTYNFIMEFDEKKLDGSPTTVAIWYQQPPKTTNAYIAAKAAYDAAAKAYSDIAAAQNAADAAKAAAQAAVDAEAKRQEATTAWEANQANTDLLNAKLSAENLALNKYQAAKAAVAAASTAATAAETSTNAANAAAVAARAAAESDIATATAKANPDTALNPAKAALTAAESDLDAAQTAYDDDRSSENLAALQLAQTKVQAAQAAVDQAQKDLDNATAELAEAQAAKTAADALVLLTTPLATSTATAAGLATTANTAVNPATPATPAITAEQIQTAVAGTGGVGGLQPVNVLEAQAMLDAAAAAAGSELVPLKATVSFNSDGTFDTVSGVTGFPPTGTLNANNFRIVPTADGASLEVRVARNLQDTPDISEPLTNYDTLSSVAQGGFYATKTTVYDCQGFPYTLEVQFKKLTANTWRWEAFFVDENGETMGQLTPTPNSGEITFDESCRIVGDDMVEISVPYSVLGRENETITLDFGGKSFGLDTLEGVTQYASETTSKGYYQDGYQMGVLNDYTVSKDGTIIGVYTNDQNQPLYRVALAQFPNPQGLEKVGDTMFRETVNSGMANINAAMVNGGGSIAGSYLEMSNVDLTEEFTRLIISQRGFQANTRVITTSDQILEEVVNLKR